MKEFLSQIVDWRCGSYESIGGTFVQSEGCRDRQDAARYRFIRDRLAIGIGDPCMFVVEFFQGDQPTFDAVIDAMMAAEPHREEA